MNKILSLGILLQTLHVAGCVADIEPDFSGIWMLEGRATEGELVMTENALAIQADYDLLEDDPSLRCEPASTSRVWANPNVRIEFGQSADQLLISYEFYDLRREIPIGGPDAMETFPSTKNVHGTQFSTMGSSVAHYSGTRLIIETKHYSPGYIRTSRGVPQSENTVTTEELWLEGDDLHLSLTYIDDTLFEIPFVLHHVFKRTGETELPLYDCSDADYDWFEKLNAPDSGDEQ